MDEPPLPELLPGDPRRHLSTEARQRTHLAHIKAEAIRLEADVRNESRKYSLFGLDAYADRKRANLKAARHVLRVLQREYSKLGLTLSEFQECMRDEIESATNSLELSKAERQLVQLEFSIPSENKRRPMGSAPTRSIQSTGKDLGKQSRLTKPKRMPGTVDSPLAAKRMEDYLAANPIGQSSSLLDRSNGTKSSFQFSYYFVAAGTNLSRTRFVCIRITTMSQRVDR